MARLGTDRASLDWKDGGLRSGAGWISPWMRNTVPRFPAHHLLPGELRWIRTYPERHYSLTSTLHSPASAPVKPAALDLGGYGGFLERSMVNGHLQVSEVSKHQ